MLRNFHLAPECPIQYTREETSALFFFGGTGTRLSQHLCLSKISKCLSAWELGFLHNSYPMLILLTTLLASLWSIFRSRASLGLENLALRHQIGVLHRSAGKRPKLTLGDRLLWICLSRLWRDWRSALAIVKPETVVAWHRAAFRLFWTWKVRCGKPGRPVISSEVRDLIRKMCRENLGWGAPRIHGELLKLGIDIGQSSCGSSKCYYGSKSSGCTRLVNTDHALRISRGASC
jgi:hypothetical protein